MNGSSWMSSLDPARRLKDVLLPGSHDAGSYGINIRSPVNRHDNPATWLTVGKIAPCIGVNFSKTQNLDLVDQFKHGVRYFDIRVAEEHGMYYFTHGLLGLAYLPELKKLLDYSAQCPYEVIVLDHRFVYGDTTALPSLIGDLVGNRNAHLLNPNSTLADFRTTGCNVVLHYRPKNAPEFWHNKMTAPWRGFTVAGEAIRFFDSVLSSESQMIGIHGTLTPTGRYIARHPFGSTQELATSLNRELIKHVHQYKRKGLSYVMYDVVEFPMLTETVIYSNFGVE